MADTDEKHRTSIAEILSVLQHLEHETKSPITQAYQRATLALQCRDLDQLRRHLYAIRGLCGKARHVLRNMGVLAGLAQGKDIELHLTRLTSSSLVKMAIEAVADAELLIGPRARTRIFVERDDFEAADLRPLYADLHLLEQALRNLIDNAVKYSYANTDVIVRAGLTASRRFYIAVTNTGIPLHLDDVQRCKERGWRGEEAQAVTGGGCGLGLWIADSIMRSHSGTLEVNATDARGLTVVRLIFPAVEESR